MIDEGFLTTEEVLAYLQVNLRTVYRLIKAGKIPAVRVGRQWRFRKRDIDWWLDSQLSFDSAQSPQVREALQQHVRGLLAPYEYPKEVEFIDQLPMTTTGKVQRRVLRLQEEARAKGQA